MLKNGPARCFSSWKTFKPDTKEFQIHNLVGGMPACKFITNEKFTLMSVPIDDIADWKKCKACFKQ